MLNNDPGPLHTPGAPRYNPADECHLCGMSPLRGLCPVHGDTIGPECDESPVWFCEQCGEELDVVVTIDGLRFCTECAEVV